MNNLIIENFNGYELHTIIWNGRPCWIASEIAKILNYSNVSKIISNCIEIESFEETIEYEILRKENLKNFVTSLKEVSNIVVNNKIRNLAILYEEGLYGFLQYSKSEVGCLFRKWLRRELLPQLREAIYSQNLENTNIVSTNKHISLDENLEIKDTMKKLDLIYKHIALLNKLMEENNISPNKKLSIILKIYSELHIDFHL